MFASRSDAGVLLPPTTSSSLGFEATLSVAMDLERRLSVNLLKSQENGPSSNRSDDSPTQHPRISPALPTGGNAKNHHEEVCTTDESLESDHSSSCEGISNHKQIPNNVSDEDEEDGNESHQTSNGNGFTWDDPVTKSEPRRRSGKAKNYRCKQCIFVATTKSDFWEHSKTHIKAEKLLTCPKCPFVTEYKHHLEYHLRNHFGSKPFKCDQCAYSCVNKSMLNSHMKSHSDIYQFQCADCSYATKYCHSLKLHLRKYHHKASDSSIDLMPNMDISANNKNKVKNGNGMSHDQQIPPFIYGINGGFHFDKEMSPDKSLKCNLCDFTTSVQEHLGKHMLIHAATENKDLCSIYGINSEALIENKKIIGNSNGTELLLNAGVRVLENPRSVLFGPTIPLDLSNNNANGREKHEQLESVVSVSATKNRRKGKAFKLDRVCFQVKQEKVEENELGDDEPASSSQSSPQGPQLMNGNEKNKVKEKNGNGRKDYECSHCGIIFKNDVMYSVHMGFHGFYDPFQCNICGEVTDDKIQFFLHIGKNAHLC